MDQELTLEEAQDARKEIAAEIWDGKAPAVVEPPEKEPEIEEEDPWAGVSPALRESFDAMSKQVESFGVVTERLKQAENRIGSITNELYAAKVKESAEKTPTKEELAAVETDDDWKELQEDFPEWAKAVDKRMAASETSTRAKIEKIESAIRKPPSVTSENLSRLREMVKIDVAHPTWETDVKTSEYQEWIAAQPGTVRQQAGSYEAKDAIAILNLFAEHKGKGKKAADIADKRKKQLEGAQSPEGKRTTPAKSEDDMTDAEYRRAEAKRIWAGG